MEETNRPTGQCASWQNKIVPLSLPLLHFFRLEQTKEDESKDGLKDLVNLVTCLTTYGVTELKPAGLTTGAPFLLPGFILPQPSVKGVFMSALCCWFFHLYWASIVIILQVSWLKFWLICTTVVCCYSFKTSQLQITWVHKHVSFGFRTVSLLSDSKN